MDLAAHIQSLKQSLEYAKAEFRSVEEELARVQQLMARKEEIRASVFGIEKMIERLEARQKNSTATGPIIKASDIMGRGGLINALTMPPESPIWRGAWQVLESAKRPLSAPEITELLQAMGWPVSGDTPVETVRTALIRKPDLFERTDRGMFQLKPGAVLKTARGVVVSAAGTYHVPDASTASDEEKK